MDGLKFGVAVIVFLIIALSIHFLLPCDHWYWNIVPIGEIPGRCL